MLPTTRHPYLLTVDASVNCICGVLFLTNENCELASTSQNSPFFTMPEQSLLNIQRTDCEREGADHI